MHTYNNFLILTFRWYNKTPYLITYNESSNLIKHLKLENFSFSWTISKQRKCPGYFDLISGKHFPCLRQIDLSNTKKERCKECEIKIGFKEGFVYRSEMTNDTAKKYFQLEHFLYLAYFSPHIIKVGTANMLRKYDRLYEQGAFAYCFFASLKGLDILEVESFISRNTNIPERISNNIKLQIIKGLNINNLPIHTLKEKELQIETVLKNTNFRKYLLKNPEFGEVYIPSIFKSKEIQNFIYLESLEEIKEISGIILGVKGNFITFGNGNNIYIINGKELVGRTIEEYNNPKEIFINNRQLNLNLLI